MNPDFHILYILSLFIHMCLGAEYAYTIEVDAGKHNCFFQTVNNTHHKFMEIDYQASFFPSLLTIYEIIVYFITNMSANDCGYIFHLGQVMFVHGGIKSCQ